MQFFLNRYILKRKIGDCILTAKNQNRFPQGASAPWGARGTTRAGLFKIRHLGEGQYSIRSMLDNRVGLMYSSIDVYLGNVGTSADNVPENAKWIISTNDSGYYVRGAYTQFVGYYAVTPWNRYYSSVSEMDFENIFVVDCVNLGNMLFELISYNLTSIKEYLIAYIPLELPIDHSYNYTKTICYENRTHCQFLRKNQTNHFIFTLHRRNKV